MVDYGAGSGVSGRPVSVADVARWLRALGRHVGDDGQIEELGALVRLEDELHGNIVDAVARLRSQPYCYSWAMIGKALGVSPQAAQQRFAKVGGARRPGGQPGHLR